MKLKDRIVGWWDKRRERALFNQSVWYWHKRGALMPYVEATEARALRLRLKEFSNFASRRWMDDRSLSTDEIKQEWLNLVVTPMAKFDFCREQANALKAAVNAMPASEIYVGVADAARKEYLDEAIRDAKAQSATIWQAQRERALRS